MLDIAHQPLGELKCAAAAAVCPGNSIGLAGESAQLVEAPRNRASGVCFLVGFQRDYVC